MVYWETAPTIPDLPQVALDWARQWQAAEKIVYSRTLAEPRSARTRIEREFDPDAVRRLKADVRHDITVDGPELAAHALRAGLVDELQMIVCPVVVGAGKRFFPDRVRLNWNWWMSRRSRRGVVVLRYAVRESTYVTNRAFQSPCSEPRPRYRPPAGPYNIGPLHPSR